MLFRLQVLGRRRSRDSLPVYGWIVPLPRSFALLACFFVICALLRDDEFLLLHRPLGRLNKRPMSRDNDVCWPTKLVLQELGALSPLLPLFLINGIFLIIDGPYDVSARGLHAEEGGPKERPGKPMQRHRV